MYGHNLGSRSAVKVETHNWGYSFNAIYEEICSISRDRDTKEPCYLYQRDTSHRLAEYPSSNFGQVTVTEPGKSKKLYSNSWGCSKRKRCQRVWGRGTRCWLTISFDCKLSNVASPSRPAVQLNHWLERTFCIRTSNTVGHSTWAASKWNYFPQLISVTRQSVEVFFNLWIHTT